MQASAINFPKMLTGIGRVLAQGLPDSCTIDRRDPVTGAWATLAAGVICRMEPLRIDRRGLLDTLSSSSQTEAAVNLNPVQARELVVSAAQDIAIGDRVLYQSLAYEVKGVEAPLSFMVLRRAVVDITPDWLP